MKAMTTTLLIALGFSSDAALAQLHPPPQPMPDMPAQPCCSLTAPPASAAPMPPSPGSSDATSGAVAPGSSGGSGTEGTVGTPRSSGAGAGPAPDSTGSADTPGAAPDSSGASGMQSEAGSELRAAASPAVAAWPKPKTQNDVTYLCGGVGQEEAAYMKKEARGYDLMLTFAARDGSYLADVNVNIRDAKGNPVLQTNCDSPMLLVDLPRSGTYRIHADAAGYTLDRIAKVTTRQRKGAHVASVVLSWPQQVAEAPGTADTSSGSSGSSTGSTGNNNDGRR